MGTYINYRVEHYNKNSKFKFDEPVRIPKYKNIFAKSYTLNWSEKVFVMKEIKHIVSWICVITDLSSENCVGPFYEKELPRRQARNNSEPKNNQEKRDKLSLKCKGYET